MLKSERLRKGSKLELAMPHSLSWQGVCVCLIGMCQAEIQAILRFNKERAEELYFLIFPPLVWKTAEEWRHD